MKISMLSLRVRPGSMQDVLAEYETNRIISSSGARDGWLFSRGDELHVVAIWENEADYLRWLEHPLRAASAARLAAYVEEVIDSYLADHAASAW